MFLLGGGHLDESISGGLEFFVSFGSAINAFDHEDNFLIDSFVDLQLELTAALTNNVVEAFEADLIVLDEAVLFLCLITLE